MCGLQIPNRVFVQKGEPSIQGYCEAVLCMAVIRRLASPNPLHLDTTNSDVPDSHLHTIIQFFQLF